MNIALIGYGKMGHEIEKLALERGHRIVAIIDQENDWQAQEEALKTAAVGLEFSTPQTVVDNIFRCFDLGLPVVVGSTGWYKQLGEICEYCKRHEKTLFYASNFSIGVNLFWEISRLAARLMKDHPAYQLHLEEIHHLQKLDKPSGTAITLAETLLNEYPSKNTWHCETENDDPLSIRIDAIRQEDVCGTHHCIYESPEDKILITHYAKSRRGFALGAIQAAEWLTGRVGPYSMQDLLSQPQ